jgi:hypothetical protein
LIDVVKAVSKHILKFNVATGHCLRAAKDVLRELLKRYNKSILKL